MKYFFLSILVLILFSVVKQSYTQEFWEIVDMPEGVGIYDVAFSQDNKLYAAVTGGDGGRIICQQYPGAEWDTVLNPGGIIGTLYVDAFNNIYGVGNYRLYFSYDKGETWNSNHVECITSSTPSLLKLNSGNFLIGTWGGIIMCDSVGNNCSYVLSTSQCEIFNDFTYNIDSSVIYAGSTNFPEEGGGVYCSYDEGLTWENTALTGSYVSSLSINSQGDLFAGSQGNFLLGYDGVYRLLNGADEWEQINPYEVVSSIAIASNDDIYLGCTLEGWPGGVRYSSDNGETWSEINDGLIGRNITGVFFNNNYMYSIDTGPPNYLYRSSEPVISGVDIGNDTSELNVCIYPNPASQYLCISGDPRVINNKNSSLHIYNNYGALLQSEIGVMPHYIDISHLESGVYFLAFECDGKVINQKLIKR
jgi:photosystem II stability/assembly factor-like uncharacterized protein